MAQQETTPKQQKRRSRAGVVLLIVLLLLAGAAGYLYYSTVKAPVDLDDPRLMAASAPMAVEERFAFSAADQTVRVKLDAADIWSLILAHTGSDFMDMINRELAPYELSLSGCAIRMDEEGVELDLEIFFRETRLVAKAPCSLEVSGLHVTLAPTAVKLGVIPLPVKGLLSAVKLEYDLALPVISQVTEVAFEKDAILLTGPMEQDIRSLVPLDKQLYHTAVFCETLQPLADALQTQEGFAAILSHLEKNPGSVEDLYRDLFTLAAPEVTAEYLDSRFGLTQRFFPEINFAAAAEEQAALSAQVTALSNTLEQFFTHLVGDYNDKKFLLSDGVFMLNRAPFQAAQYGQGKFDALFGPLDPESVFLVVVDVEGGFIRKTSSFYRIADENQQFTQSVDFNKTYILGCVLRSVDGDPFVMYEAEINAAGNTYSRDIVLRPLTEEAVRQLQVPGKFGVYTG